MEEGWGREDVMHDASSQSGPMVSAAKAMANTPQSSSLVWEGSGLVGTQIVHPSSTRIVETHDLRGSTRDSTLLVTVLGGLSESR